MEEHDVTWTLRAVADVSDITGYIAADNPVAAQRWETGLIERIQRVAKFPKSGRVVPEFRRVDLREIIYGRYRLLYQVTVSHIVVVRVLEGHHRSLDESSLD